MECRNEYKKRRLLIAVPAELKKFMPAFCSNYEKNGIGTASLGYLSALPEWSKLPGLANGYDAMMVIGLPRHGPRKALSGPVLKNPDNEIPVAWMPGTTGSALLRFGEVIGKVHSRKKEIPSLALLSQRHPRYISLSERMRDILKADRKYKVFQWNGESVYREDMLTGLASGIGAAIYFGHGRPVGWVGYYGLRAHHFDGSSGEPLGALFSLCCSTASRRKTALSFAESLLLKGVSAAGFAAVKPTLHTDNMRWAVRIGKALLQGTRTIGELIIASNPQTESSMEAYRIIGDPFAPLWAPQRGMLLARRIKTYP